MSAAGIPSWVLLEPFVFRRDDDESFPDESKAPIRVTATTSWGARFCIAFSLAEPPHISRLYAQLPVPGFLNRRVWTPLCIVATHHHLVLLRVANRTSKMLTVQDFFVFTAKEDPSLKKLPPCTEPDFDYSVDGNKLLPPSEPAFYYSFDYLDGGSQVSSRRRHRRPARLLNVFHLGLWCQGQEFVVAELTIFKPTGHNKAFADICLLHSHEDQLGATWKSMRVEFLSTDDPGDANLFQISWFFIDAPVIAFDKYLCWIDYHRGIIFSDMSKLPNPPTVSFIWFPVELPISGTRKGTSTSYYRAVSVVDRGRALKFINITRDDDIPFAALTSGTGFTITCHTLMLGGGRMVWKKDYKVTSNKLWAANTAERLPRRILMFPQVDIDRPHVAHFLSVEFGSANKKMWAVSIDMSTMTVESSSLFINGDEGLKTDDADLIQNKSTVPLPFIPCEFPKFLVSPPSSSRKRRRME